MESYESVIGTLEAEPTAVAAVFRGLEQDQWRRPTLLVPVDPDLPRWTVFELAGHFDIAIRLTRMLIAGREDVQPARDRTSFFINPRSETGPVVYSYAYTMVEGKTAADMPDVLAETFTKTIADARAVPASLVGPGYFAPTRVDEFVASRIAEAVVHGIDLAQALGRRISLHRAASPSPPRSWMTSWRSGQRAAGQPACRTTWTGSWRLPAAPNLATTGCR